MTTTTRDVLVRARGLIEQGWCQGVGARDARGHEVGALMREACSWCTLGALSRALDLSNTDAYGVDYTRAREAIADAIGRDCDGGRAIAVWNDHRERTQADVLAAFDRAIAACEADDLAAEAADEEQSG